MKRSSDQKSSKQKSCAISKLFQEHLSNKITSPSCWPLPATDVSTVVPVTQSIFPSIVSTGKVDSKEEDVPYAYIADTLADISSVGSRLESSLLLTMMFFHVVKRAPSSLVTVVYLTVNKLAPAHEGIELGIGDGLLIKVVGEVCGMTDKQVREEYQKTGDLAEIAQEKKGKMRTLVKSKDLTAKSVLKAFRSIADTSGKDSQKRRGDIIKTLVRDAKGPETNFLIRALQGKMRIGVAELTVLTAIGHTFALIYAIRHYGERLQNITPEDMQALLDKGSQGLGRIYNEVPSYDILVAAVLEHGFELLDPNSEIFKKHRSFLSIRPGLPVHPMLAHPTSGVSAVLNKFNERRLTCEYKYDGERGQLHYDGKFHIFSRNSETHTTKYPDVIQMLPETFDKNIIHNFIIDSEVVAVDEFGKMQNFQTLQHRGRKNIDIKDITVKVCVFAFDILYINGESILHKTLEERRKILYDTFKEIPGKFQFAQKIDTDDVEEIQEFLLKSIADGAEGLMVKTLKEEAEYQPAKRSHFWLKLKKDYMDSTTDTLDLVPIAAYHGKGKRSGVFGGFLMGCYDPKSEEYQSICKLGTGLSDADLESLTDKLRNDVVTGDGTKMPVYYRTNDKPDVWLLPSLVFEIKAADLSISPVHLAGFGLVNDNKGIALRFPRFLKIREDKCPTDATTASQVAYMYREQALAVSALEAAIDELDEN